MPSQTSLIGTAGEHYVLCELLRQGYIAALAPTGAPNVDIVVTDMEGSRLCAIQVKTRRGIRTDGGWHMNAKQEEFVGDHYFYCFVDFQEPQKARPLVYVIPSAKVAKAISDAHKKWRSTPGRNGQPHQDTPMRRLLPDYGKVWPTDNPYPAGWLDPYCDAWNLLGLDNTNTEASLPNDD
ncbi:MAG: hypothetical protein P4L90_05965 [Rhodopila sp.]|nr:hypothetical protein [Rhodopila sp.]